MRVGGCEVGTGEVLCCSRPGVGLWVRDVCEVYIHVFWSLHARDGRRGFLLSLGGPDGPASRVVVPGRENIADPKRMCPLGDYEESHAGSLIVWVLAPSARQTALASGNTSLSSWYSRDSWCIAGMRPGCIVSHQSCQGRPGCGISHGPRLWLIGSLSPVPSGVLHDGSPTCAAPSTQRECLAPVAIRGLGMGQAGSPEGFLTRLGGREILGRVHLGFNGLAAPPGLISGPESAMPQIAMASTSSARLTYITYTTYTHCRLPPPPRDTTGRIKMATTEII